MKTPQIPKIGYCSLRVFINSFIYSTLTLNKVSRSHFLRRNTLCPADLGHFEYVERYITVPFRNPLYA